MRLDHRQYLDFKKLYCSEFVDRCYFYAINAFRIKYKFLLSGGVTPPGFLPDAVHILDDSEPAKWTKETVVGALDSLKLSDDLTNPQSARAQLFWSEVSVGYHADIGHKFWRLRMSPKVFYDSSFFDTIFEWETPKEKV